PRPPPRPTLFPYTTLFRSRRARATGAPERELRPARPARPGGRALRAGPQRCRLAVPLRARGRSGSLVSRGRGLRARGRPLARLGPAAPLPHGRRERRALAGPRVPHLLGGWRRARRLDDRRRLDRAAPARPRPVAATVTKPLRRKTRATNQAVVRRYKAVQCLLPAVIRSRPRRCSPRLGRGAARAVPRT